MKGTLSCLASAGLDLGESLAVKFVRDQDVEFVATEYTVDEERATDFFNAFLVVRAVHDKSKENAKDDVASSPGDAIRPEAIRRDAIRRDDVAAVACLLCAPDVVESQVAAFMRRFDPDSTGVVTREAYHRVLQEECHSLRLNFLERVFFTFDEPTSSRTSLRVAVAVMLLITISSVGFVAATEEALQVPSPGGRWPPKEVAALEALEAGCIYLFTAEYLCRGATVHGVRDFLRQSTIEFELLGAPAKVSKARHANRAATPETPTPLPPPPPPFEASMVASKVAPEPAGPSGGLSGGAGGSSARLSVLGQLESPQGLSDGPPDGPPDGYHPPGGAGNLRSRFARRGRGGWRRTVIYLTSAMNLIDAVAILPFYLEALAGIGGGGLGVLRILRLARVFRLFKFGQLNEGVTLLGNVVRQSYDSLKLLTFFALIGCVLYGSLIHLCEQGTWQAPPPGEAYKTGQWLRADKFGDGGLEVSPFVSIPRSMWWVVVTATTVGYGDLYPTTAAGKALASLTMLSGVLVLALPITIISNNFTQEYAKLMELKEARRRSDEVKCGQALPLVKGGTDGQGQLGKYRKYRGPLCLRLERHLEMLLQGAQLLRGLEALVERGAAPEAAAVAIAREVLGLMNRAAWKEPEATQGGGVPAARLRCKDVDQSAQLVLLWFARIFPPPPEDFRHARNRGSNAADEKGGGGGVWLADGKESGELADVREEEALELRRGFFALVLKVLPPVTNTKPRNG